MYFRGPRDILLSLADLDNKQFAGLVQPHPEQTPGGFSLLRLSFPRFQGAVSFGVDKF
jgi:hypothetical protein